VLLVTLVGYTSLSHAEQQETLEPVCTAAVRFTVPVSTH